MGNVVENRKFKVKGNLKRGDKFRLMGIQWTIIKITGNGYKCFADKVERRIFDNITNNWANSSLRKYLNEEFFEKLAKEVGVENIIPFERNLISHDGLKDYGTVTDKVSIISFDEYRANRDVIPNVEDYYWWTLTPDSVESNGIKYWVRVVSPSGCIYCDGCNGGNGVRPFCIFSSSIFKSEE